MRISVSTQLHSLHTAIYLSLHIYISLLHDTSFLYTVTYIFTWLCIFLNIIYILHLFYTTSSSLLPHRYNSLHSYILHTLSTHSPHSYMPSHFFFHLSFSTHILNHTLHRSFSKISIHSSTQVPILCLLPNNGQ